MIIQTTRSRTKGLPRLVLLAAISIGLVVFSLPALADAPTATYASLPGNLKPSTVIAHADGTVTLDDRDCPYYLRDTSLTADKSYSTLALASGNNTEIDTFNKITSTWQTQPCRHSIVAGVDGTSYVIQVGASPNYPYRIVATRDKAVLWTHDIKDPNLSCNRNVQIGSIALGYDGNLYASVIIAHKNSSCPALDGVFAISTKDATEQWHAYLPGTGSNASIDRSQLLVMPYEGGIATRNASSMYFYEYDGDPVGTSTFSPTLNGGQIEYATVVPSTGRAYLTTSKYVGGASQYEKHLYYKDVGNATITEVTLPSSGMLSEILPTPANGVVC